mmetsp:Transcript_20415/g.60412  ORF Transcript_20415/g.60412 Transcript_20415/m.60412 type:complete len:188 (-) Transcript_20415:183-746(-)
MPAGDGLDGKGTEAAAAEYMRLQGGTQSNMIDAASSFATGDLKSREEVDAMMEGESVESKTGSAMHSSTLLLNDLGKAGKALGAAAYANVDQAGHGVQQALGFAPPDEKAAVRRQWLLEGDLPQPGQLSPTDGPSKSVGCYDANHVWTEPCQRAGRTTHAELLAAQGYGRPSTQGHRLAMANGPGRL